MTPAALSLDEQLAEEIQQFYEDPLGFVRFAYPWNEARTPLAQYDGPDVWQADILKDVGREVRARRFDGAHAVLPLRYAVSSGHGIGKSTVVAWIVDWILSTRPFSKGTITANTFAQLEQKTWAQIRKWTNLCITGHWFEVSAKAIRHREYGEGWGAAAQTCREENSESFAGQHAADSTSFYIFDEASAVPDGIWEVAEGGLSDGEPAFFAFGNPTRSTGKFYRICFGADRGRWSHRVIDSRSSRFANKELIQQWEEDHGEDSDFFRVRVRGLPPRASDLQYIDSERVWQAQKNNAIALPDSPLVVGVDIARGGGDNNVICFRRGGDARSLPAIKIPGEQTRDSMRMVSKLGDILSDRRPERRVSMMFVDGTGIGGPIVDRLKELGHKNVVEIQFGGRCPDDKHYANMRSWMWSRMKDWLPHGAIPKDSDLEADLTGPGWKPDKQDRVVLESKEDMKKRGLSSPDFADALALTFAQNVLPAVETTRVRPSIPQGSRSWMA